MRIGRQEVDNIGQRVIDRRITLAARAGQGILSAERKSPDVLAAIDHSFCIEEAQRQVGILPRGSQQGCKGLGIDTDFKRLLYDYLVGLSRSQPSIVPAYFRLCRTLAVGVRW